MLIHAGFIGAPPAPNVIFSASVQGPQASFDPVVTSETGTPYVGAVEWDFGDGSPVDTNATPTAHNYAAAGPFTAQLTTPVAINGSRIDAQDDNILSIDIGENTLIDRLTVDGNASLTAINYATDHSAMRRLHLTSTGVTDAPPLAIMPNLTELHLDNCAAIPAAQLDSLDWSLLPSLKDLRLTNTSVTDIDYSAPHATAITIQPNNCLSWVTADFSGVTGALTLLCGGSTSIGPVIEAATSGANLVRLNVDNAGIPANFSVLGHGNLVRLDISTNALLTNLTLATPGAIQTLRCANNNNLQTIVNLDQQANISDFECQGSNFTAAQVDQVLADLVATGATGGTFDYSDQPGGAHLDANRGIGAGFGAGEHLDVLINTRGWTRNGSQSVY